MTKLKFYLWLAGINLFISTFTFGGGYVVVPMIRKYYVEGKDLFSNDELIEMAAVAQSSPGAIAINLSVLAGKKSCGYTRCLHQRHLCHHSAARHFRIDLKLVCGFCGQCNGDGCPKRHAGLCHGSDH